MKKKFNFKIQQYQTGAVVKVFNGQGFYDKVSFIRDIGKMKSDDMQMAWGMTDEEIELYDPTNDTGYKNELVEHYGKKACFFSERGRKKQGSPPSVTSSALVV